MSAKKKIPGPFVQSVFIKEAAISLLVETQNLQDLTVQKVTAKAN